MRYARYIRQVDPDPQVAEMATRLMDRLYRPPRRSGGEQQAVRIAFVPNPHPEGARNGLHSASHRVRACAAASPLQPTPARKLRFAAAQGGPGYDAAYRNSAWLHPHGAASYGVSVEELLKQVPPTMYYGK